MNIKDVPKELLENRNSIECNYIFCIYKDISILDDYPNIKNEDDIITEDGIFYYGLVQKLHESGYKTIDSISVYTFLEDKPAVRKRFEKFGGWSTVSEITSLLSVDNIKAYHDELVKNNLLIRLNESGFNVLKNLDNLKQMSYDEVYSYFEFQLSNIAVTKIDKFSAVDLTQGYDEYIDMWNEGSDVGYEVGSRWLHNRLMGIHKKNLLLHAAGIGWGKTSSAISWYILPAIEHQDVTIIANEQGVSEWRQMILSTVLFNKVGNVAGFSRHKMIEGNYTEEQRKKMSEAAEWLAQQPGKINFIETQDYSVATIKKIISKYSALGCSLFIVDTLKPESDADKQAWGLLADVAKELFLLAKKKDIAVVATCQLSGDAMSRSFLDLTCVGKSKAIAETATQVVMFRPIKTDEIEKIVGYKFDGKIRREIKLDPAKQYIMVFTPKNRFGEVSPQIIMERNLNFNTYKDVCYYDCPYDEWRRK